MLVINPKTISVNIVDEIRKALVKVEINCMFAHAVLDYKVDGIIAIDSIVEPKSFYIRHLYGMSLLFGKTDNQAFAKSLRKKRIEENWGDEYLQVFPETSLNDICPSNSIITTLERVNFKFNKNLYNTNQVNNNASFEIVKVSKQMFNCIQGTVVPTNFWNSFTDFQKHAIGFSIVENDKPVSTAFAAFIHNNMLELGIETHPDYRGKNLAYYCCTALIDYCIERNLEPVWACRQDNEGSYNLALKLGFEPRLSIPYYKLENN